MPAEPRGGVDLRVHGGVQPEELALAGIDLASVLDFSSSVNPYGPCPEVVEAVLDAMKASMMKGERIELRGFGVFQVKPRKRGIGRNPRTGKEVKIPPGRTIRFKPGKDLQNIGG